MPGTSVTRRIQPVTQTAWTGGSGFGVEAALFSLGERAVFKWMVFFVLILAAILAFVSWVMGVPIPGMDGFQQNPFNQ
jgi:hypothetical protein